MKFFLKLMAAPTQYHLAVLLGAGLFTTLASSAAPIAPGVWQCHSKVTRPEAQYRIQATTTVGKHGQLAARGRVYAYNPLLQMELPMNFTATGSWTESEDQVKGKIEQANIQSGSVLIDQLASNLTAQVKKTPYFSANIIEASDQALVLSDGQQQQVHCKR